MDYKFPIYDTLAISSYEKIRLKFKPELEIPALKKEFDISYFACLSQLNSCSGIYDFDKLDNLLWLLGKFTEGSFSIVLDKKTYIDLTKGANVKDKIKSKNKQKKDEIKKDKITVDDLIRIYLKSNSDLQKIFNKNDDLIKFIQFSLQFVQFKNN